jgi:hypothetical protein
MNASMFSALLTIAAAPVVDAPLSITITRKGLQTLAAHNAPVPVVRRRQESTPTTFCDTSCVACKLCNVWGELTCSDCAEAKATANATRIEATERGTISGLCGALVNGTDDCPCDEGICLEITSSRP